jgi:hypothetical protein
MRHFASLLLLAALALPAGDKKPVYPARASNDNLEAVADVYLEKEAVTQKLGGQLPAGMDGFLMVVEVELTPRGTETFTLDRDDFVLICTNDGQRSKPFAPSQIAGTGALRISTKKDGSYVMAENRGPAWGGVNGPPIMAPGNVGGVGNATGGVSTAETRVDEGKGEKVHPMLAVLKEKELPHNQPLTEPVKGLLYFPVEGKHKRKDIMLLYRGRAGKLDMQFR